MSLAQNSIKIEDGKLIRLEREYVENFYINGLRVNKEVNQKQISIIIKVLNHCLGKETINILEWLASLSL